MGFEYFYGFIGGDTNQWEPNLFRNTTQIYPFQGQPPGTWNLATAMADDAIDYMNRIASVSCGMRRSRPARSASAGHTTRATRTPRPR